MGYVDLLEKSQLRATQTAPEVRQVSRRNRMAALDSPGGGGVTARALNFSSSLQEGKSDPLEGATGDSTRKESEKM